ncbi:histone-lysine N-methyltransferase SETMAR-like [Vespa mandarinia]|uniref:histone-lysine N-methyltransferase SETMAR-like n=1 Tax=Vespa mandarinia TaxID=7446 RepID=UPI00160EA37E|nr:histone-lysine N-methyltransferase SETMAR-like [Vespa mandarinia]
MDKWIPHELTETRCARWLDRDEACPHTPWPSLHPRKILITVWWNVTRHPPYSLYLSPTDFHLKLFLRAKKYEKEDRLKNAISEFTDSKDQNFFKTGIYTLKSRWEKCIDVNGAYFE